MTFEYRRHQLEAADAVENAYRAGITRPLVNMCVGSGKSLTMAELARRNWQRGERTIILSHRQELVSQDKAACDTVGVPCGINAAKLGERAWRGPVISAMINSVCNSALAFGPVQNIFIDECHLVPHSEAGMYRAFLRAFPGARIGGFSGTTFRLQSGSLTDGEGALFQSEVYQYTIPDGIRDGYLVPGFSAPAEDKVDVTKLKKTAGEYTAASQDAQMIALMDSHIMQMLSGGSDRRAWLIFEASQKAALAMTDRLNAWGVPAAAIIDKTKNRETIYSAFERGQLRALVNVETLTTGYDSQRIDLVCFRRRTASLGLYVQMCGRGLRTIGGNIDASIRAGKSDCLYYDFSGLIDAHGPLDFLRPKETKSKLVSCESCGKRNAGAAMKCWACNEPMTKNCPACLQPIQKGLLDCPLCEHDMRVGGAVEGDGPKPANLLERPSGAALISSFAKNVDREGGWIAIRKSYRHETGETIIDTETHRLTLPTQLQVYGDKAKWIRMTPDGAEVTGLLIPNGSSRTSALQISLDGPPIVVPIPSTVADAA